MGHRRGKDANFCLISTAPEKVENIDYDAFPKLSTPCYHYQSIEIQNLKHTSR